MILQKEPSEFLSLSGIQHFAYCPRQWALIHLEKQWIENVYTMDGKHLHEHVHNPNFFEARGDRLVARSVPLISYVLGLYGVSDVVEFHTSMGAGIILKGYPGKWKPVPVEYKRGKPKKDIIDEVQLCAQAICLEEMLSINIEYGYFFYGLTKHRSKVLFSHVLRDEVRELAEEMQYLFDKQITPKALENTKKCKYCSLKPICFPELISKKDGVNRYIKKFLK